MGVRIEFLKLDPEEREDILGLHVEEEAAEGEGRLARLQHDYPPIALGGLLSRGGVVPAYSLHDGCGGGAPSFDDDLRVGLTPKLVESPALIVVADAA